MTRQEPNPRQKQQAAPKPHPVRTRIFTWAVVGLCTLAAVITLFDRKDLPPAVRNNTYVAKVYHERDAAIAATSSVLGRHGAAAPEAPDANADMKQQGYPKDDRTKLDSLITNGDKSP